MFSSQKSRGRRSHTAFSSLNADVTTSPIAARRGTIEERRRPAARFGKVLAPPFAGQHSESVNGEEAAEDENENDYSDQDDGAGETSPLLPIFSAEHLDSLPVYNITHTIRLLIIQRCETTLSWDQLRTPQVSSFLVKPILEQIRSSHFSKASLYALMANCLQFSKEIHTNPGNSGFSQTRGMVSELLAMKLLREFSTRDLIDALSYDFSPLQGVPGIAGPLASNWEQNAKRTQSQSRVARISTLEVAIRAQAKRFLAHPLVTQQLNGIWSGAIVFHHAADTLHRPHLKQIPNQNRGYGAISSSRQPLLQASPDRLQPAKQRDHCEPTLVNVRRSVTLYDPKEASLLKMSRLRVPRYRQFLSTCSFAVLLGLFVAVLVQRSRTITGLEVVFWLWSVGFLLDEVVGFNEQGFSLYILSFWNTFDVGILCLLVCYYIMRLYGMLLPSVYEQRQVADLAYDILAVNAVLLFPRLFSVLDHYRYFSQLLIAFRMMAMDLVAVFVLIIISCSGFLVAFTLSFGKTDQSDPRSVAYALFQILMGFTPAAWEVWPGYNILGKATLTLFLFICHFLIVTILITVLTNSFMSIVQNANEEHQFVFAVNTISMVKSDALFSYIAPTNVIAWLLTPLRYLVPFRRYVLLNRNVIKATHFPVLFGIYVYERLVLRSALYEAMDLVERGSRFEAAAKIKKHDSSHPLSPKLHRVREHSVATFHKDKALDEVFQRPFPRDTLLDSSRNHRRRNTSNVVSQWMSNLGPDGTTNPPQEQDRTILDRLEARQSLNRTPLPKRGTDAENAAETTLGNISMASDPEDLAGVSSKRLPKSVRPRLLRPPSDQRARLSQTEADGDDELVTNDEEDILSLNEPKPGNVLFRAGTGFDNLVDRLPSHANTSSAGRQVTASGNARGSFEAQRVVRQKMDMAPSPQSDNRAKPLSLSTSLTRNIQNTPPIRLRQHSRMPSATTMIYDPLSIRGTSSTSSADSRLQRKPGRSVGNASPVKAPTPSGRRTPKRAGKAVARPIMPPHAAFRSAPNLAGLLSLANGRKSHRRSSLTAFDLGSDLGDNKAVGGGIVHAALPASFATQMAYANVDMRERRAAQKQEEEADNARMSKLVLARMMTLEEGFKEVVREVQEMRKQTGSGKSRALPSEGSVTRAKPVRESKNKVTPVDLTATKEDTSEDLAFNLDVEGTPDGNPGP